MLGNIIDSQLAPAGYEATCKLLVRSYTAPSLSITTHVWRSKLAQHHYALRNNRVKTLSQSAMLVIISSLGRQYGSNNPEAIGMYSTEYLGRAKCLVVLEGPGVKASTGLGELSTTPLPLVLAMVASVDHLGFIADRLVRLPLSCR
jgi:hypothetical protein